MVDAAVESDVIYTYFECRALFRGLGILSRNNQATASALVERVKVGSGSAAG